MLLNCLSVFKQTDPLTKTQDCDKTSTHSSTLGEQQNSSQPQEGEKKFLHLGKNIQFTYDGIINKGGDKEETAADDNENAD
ncbi:hypothetical protein CHS0354_032490 [Potamilus streckersoni]|uniref:Uncharacterized protein n=1 Tax=Potamilus streckersoni TaxID=2493646 RepID=A0AAE0SQ37_9BIVA|nr:hypothetical protein CHS0354_032490 [Potamilus streckersoni]